MTERTEIERLLQKTGRTLEELPEFYPEDQQQKLYREVIEKQELWENRVLHQSDVIELLIGALQDSELLFGARTASGASLRFAQCSMKNRLTTKMTVMIGLIMTILRMTVSVIRENVGRRVDGRRDVTDINVGNKEKTGD